MTTKRAPYNPQRIIYPDPFSPFEHCGTCDKGTMYPCDICGICVSEANRS